MRLVDNADAMIQTKSCKIVYYFAEHLLLFERYEGRVNFCHGMPNADAIDRLTDALVVFDDMTE